MPEVMPVLTTPQDPENSASLNPLSVPSSNNLSVSPPGQSPEISSFKRKVSQQFCESFGLSKNLENEDPNLLLTDDAISKTGATLLKDYIRDRLYRHGFLPSDEIWFREENNNNIGSLQAIAAVVNNGDMGGNNAGNVSPSEPQRRLSASRSLSRSNSFNRSLSNRGSISVDGKPPEVDKKSGKRDKPPTPVPLTIDTVAIHIRRLCLYLERKHSSIFREVSRPLNITMSSLGVIRGAFQLLCDDVLEAGSENCKSDVINGNFDDGNSSKRINPNWGKIASLFVLSSTFCIDCLVQGHADYLADVLSIAHETMFREELIDWIRGVGGWANVVNCTSEIKKDPIPWSLVVGVAIAALVALIAIFIAVHPFL